MHSLLFFFFNDTATTEIYTLSLHDALPIYIGDDEAEHRVAEELERLVVDDAAAHVLVGARGVGHRVLEQAAVARSEEHTSELQSQSNLVCRLLLEKKKISR